MAEITRRSARVPRPAPLARAGLPEPYAPLTPARDQPAPIDWHEYRKASDKRQRRQSRRDPWDLRCRVCDDTRHILRRIWTPQRPLAEGETPEPIMAVHETRTPGGGSTTQVALEMAIYGRREVACPQCNPRQYRTDMAELRNELSGDASPPRKRPRRLARKPSRAEQLAAMLTEHATDAGLGPGTELVQPVTPDDPLAGAVAAE